jgi:hypothetical protein
MDTTRPSTSIKKSISHLLSATALSGIIIGTILGCFCAIIESVDHEEKFVNVKITLGMMSLMLWMLGLLLFFVLSILNLWCADVGASMTIVSRTPPPPLRVIEEQVQPLLV